MGNARSWWLRAGGARIVLIACIATAVPGRARAQTEAARKANAAQNSAVHEYEEGRYGDALGHFQEAYRLKPEPSLLLFMARCRYKLRQFEAAKSCLFDFLKEDPKSVYGSEAFELLTRIEKETSTAPQTEARSCLSPALPGAGATASTAPAPSPAPAASSAPAAPKATVSGWPAAEKPASSSGAKPASSGWPLGRQATPQPAAVARGGHGPWSYAVIGASLAAAGVGTYFGMKNMSATSDWRAARTAADSAAAGDRARSAARSANFAWAASGVLLATGLGLFFFTEF